MSTRVWEVVRTVLLPPLPEARTVMETATGYRIAGKSGDSKLQNSKGFK
jgi:hypothetical protein